MPSVWYTSETWFEITFSPTTPTNQIMLINAWTRKQACNDNKQILTDYNIHETAWWFVQQFNSWTFMDNLQIRRHSYVGHNWHYIFRLHATSNSEDHCNNSDQQWNACRTCSQSCQFKNNILNSLYYFVKNPENI